jgi:integrase
MVKEVESLPAKSLRNLQSEARHVSPPLSELQGQRRARALKHGDWLTFDDYPGLRLERNGKSRLFLYRYKSPVDGKSRRTRIGRWPAVTWERAVTRHQELRMLREDGIDPRLARREKRATERAAHEASRKASKRSRITARKIVEAYLAVHKKTVTEKTAYNTKRLFESRALPAFGERPAHEITSDHAEPFLAKLKQEAPQVGRLLRSQLAACWDHARASNLLPTTHPNPWRNTLTKLQAQHSDRHLNDSELAVFLKRLPELGPETEQAFRLALYCGVRTGEAAAFKGIDLERGAWRIALGKGKHRERKDSTYTLKLPRQALTLLRARDARPFEVTQEDLGAALREVKCFGIEKFTPHALRHTVRTGLSRLKVQHEIAELCIGHTQSGGYNHHRYESEVAEALQQWCDHLEALSAPSVVPLSKTGSRQR